MYARSDSFSTGVCVHFHQMKHPFRIRSEMDIPGSHNPHHACDQCGRTPLQLQRPLAPRILPKISCVCAYRPMRQNMEVPRVSLQTPYGHEDSILQGQWGTKRQFFRSNSITSDYARVAGTPLPTRSRKKGVFRYIVRWLSRTRSSKRAKSNAVTEPVSPASAPLSRTSSASSSREALEERKPSRPRVSFDVEVTVRKLSLTLVHSRRTHVYMCWRCVSSAINALLMAHYQCTMLTLFSSSMVHNKTVSFPHLEINYIVD